MPSIFTFLGVDDNDLLADAAFHSRNRCLQSIAGVELDVPYHSKGHRVMTLITFTQTSAVGKTLTSTHAF